MENLKEINKDLCEKYDVKEILPILVSSLSCSYEGMKHGEANLLSDFNDDRLILSLSNK